MDKLYIVMPAYNESENISEVVKQWYPVVEKIGKESRLVIANDGSKDNTCDILDSLETDYPQLLHIEKPNSGHGSTLMLLYNRAIADKADFVFQTDSDGQTDPNEFWAFWNSRKDFNFNIGTRRTRQDGTNRKFVTRVLRLVVLLMFHENVKDANTPFRLMNVIRLQEILKVIPNDFFLSNVAISTIAVKWHETIKWYPITFRPRQGGVNSINFNRIIGIGFKAFKDFSIINKNLKNNKLQ